MASTKPEFKLNETLEGLVKTAEKSTSLSRMGRIDTRESNIDLRTATAEFYKNNTYLAASEAAFANLLGLDHLSKLVDVQRSLSDDEYKVAKDSYLPALDKELRSLYYLNLIKDGVVPKKLSKELGAVKGALELSDKIKQALNRNDSALASQIAHQYLNGLENRRIDLSSLYGQGETQRSKTLNDYAITLEKQAIAQLQEGKLYAELDKGIDESEYGKAASLTSMYSAYNAQQKKNEKAKADADKAKAGKK